MKCSRHDSSLRGSCGSARAERRLEARDHHRVLLGQELADERRGIGVRAAEQAQEVLAAALRIARERQRRQQQRAQDPFARQRPSARLRFEARQQLEARLVHRVEPARQHRLEQLLLACRSGS